MTKQLINNTEDFTLSEPKEFLLYTTDSGRVKINLALKDETVWLTQKINC